MSIVVRSIRAVGAGFNLHDVSIILGIISIIIISIIVGASRGNMYCDGLYASELLLALLLRDVFVQNLLALLTSPLDLLREDGYVFVALQAIAVCKNMDEQLCCRKPEATVGHGMQSYCQATTSRRDFFHCLPFFVWRS